MRTIARTGNQLSLIAVCPVVFALAIAGSCQSVSAVKVVVDDKADRKNLKLVAEYKHNILEAFSSDGRLILFYQTSTPMRTFTYRSDTGTVKPEQPEVYDDVLRVVELESPNPVRTRRAATHGRSSGVRPPSLPLL